jgi:hypothetical protein
LKLAALIFCPDECAFCVHRAAFAWFSVEPGWYKMTIPGMAKEEAQAVAIFSQYLAQDSPLSVYNGEGSSRSKRSSRSGSQTLPRSTSLPQVINYSQSLISLF